MPLFDWSPKWTPEELEAWDKFYEEQELFNQGNDDDDDDDD